MILGRLRPPFRRNALKPSTPNRSRTCNLRFRRPKDEVPNSNASKHIGTEDAGVSSTGSSNAPDADLARLVECWSKLPVAIQVAMRALVQSVTDLENRSE